MGRTLRVGLGVLALGGSALMVNALAVGGSEALVRSDVTAAKYPPGPQGVNYTIHTSADPNFCFTNMPVPDLNRATSIQQCAANDTQHWTWAQSADNSSVLVDGGGQCLEAAKKANKLAQANPCTFLTPEHFLYTEQGQIKTVSGDLCLQDAQATSNAAVTFASCVKGLTTQIWMLGH
jgi:Ricin-type beta-trefoil lectin domain